MNEPLPRRIAWFAPWTWKRRWKVATFFLLAIAPLYTLSIGPAVLLVSTGVLKVRTTVTVYLPVLRFVEDYCPLLVNPYWSYARMWNAAAAQEVFNWYLVEMEVEKE